MVRFGKVWQGVATHCIGRRHDYEKRVVEAGLEGATLTVIQGVHRG